MKNNISVIMVVKNEELYLARAIESVLSQSILPEEILLIDGNSTDATPEIAKRYSNVTYFSSARRWTGQRPQLRDLQGIGRMGVISGR